MHQSSQNDTPPTLLARVRDPSDQTSWQEFEQRYRDLIRRYCMRRGLRGADVDDALQIAMLHLAKGLPSFEYDPKRGRFRSYLGQVTRSAIARHFSRKNPVDGALPLVDGIAEPETDHDAETWEREWENHHYRLAMETVRVQFDPRSLQVFERLVQGDSVEEIAATFALSPQAVHQIKYRIKTRLRDLVAAQIREEDDPYPTT